MLWAQYLGHASLLLKYRLRTVKLLHAYIMPEVMLPNSPEPILEQHAVKHVPSTVLDMPTKLAYIAQYFNLKY